jgi:hypothetical protein
LLNSEEIGVKSCFFEFQKVLKELLMPIIISKNGKNAKRVERTNFKQEEELQKYIFKDPDCISIEDIKEDVQFVIDAL